MDGCQDGTPTSKTFEHVASEIGAEEAEEVGVEHLLRSVTCPAVCQSSTVVLISVASTSGGVGRRISHNFRNGVHFLPRNNSLYIHTLPRQQGEREIIWGWGFPSSRGRGRLDEPALVA